MSFAFRPGDKSMQHAVRRIALNEIAEARALATDDGPLGPRIHGMRRSVKKLRGLLRLVGPVMPDFSSENKVLRNAGRGIATLRTTEVMLATARAVIGGLPPEQQEAVSGPFRDIRNAAAAPEILEMQISAFESAYAALAERVGNWQIKGKTFSALAPGLTQTWDGGRDALAGALADPSADHIHEWRKRIKDHWYQARLLSPIMPSLMEPHAAVADDLGETLGLYNDLAEFSTAVAALPLAAGLHETLAARITARQQELLATATHHGRFFFAEKAAGLVGRWQGWWDIWRAAR